MKTPMQELIESLERKKLHVTSVDVKLGINQGIMEAKSLQEKEKQMIIDAWNDAYAIGCCNGSNDYTTVKDTDTAEYYFKTLKK
jgi:hypothetical protein